MCNLLLLLQLIHSVVLSSVVPVVKSVCTCEWMRVYVQTECECECHKDVNGARTRIEKSKGKRKKKIQNH